MQSKRSSESKKSVSMTFSSYFNTIQHSELTIISGNERVLLHKIIVCARSPYFKESVKPDARLVFAREFTDTTS